MWNLNIHEHVWIYIMFHTLHSMEENNSISSPFSLRTLCGRIFSWLADFCSWKEDIRNVKVVSVVSNNFYLMENSSLCAFFTIVGQSIVYVTSWQRCNFCDILITRASRTGWCSPNRFWTQARNFAIPIWWSFLYNSFEIRLQKTKLYAGHNFAARSCCDLDLQGSDLNDACDMSSQYGDHFCETVLKFNFK